MKYRLLAAALALAFTACHGPDNAAPSHELRFATANDPKTFDPHRAAESASETVRDLTDGVLLRINPITDEVRPELAASFAIKDNSHAIAFHLRAALKFSDGSPLTSAEVAGSLKHLLETKDATIGEAFKQDNPQITVASPLDLEVRYQVFKPRLDRIFSEIAITPPAPGKLPATAGPFSVAESHPGEYVRLARNPYYWNRPLPKLDSIRIDTQSNRDIEATRFLRGELQIMDRISPEIYDRIAKQKPGSARNLDALLDSEFFWFNQAPAKTLPGYKRRWFTSTAFRHAISSTVHREDIVKIVYRGYAHVASGPTSSASQFWFNSSLKPLPTDPAASLKSLAAEGFTLKDNVLRDRDGHPVEFSLLTQSGKSAREKMAAIVADDLGKIGIHVNVVTLDFDSLVDRISQSLDYEAALLGFNSELDPVDEMNVWLSSGPQHPWYAKQKSPATPWEARIDELEKQQALEQSRSIRKKAIDELQTIVVAEEPMIYLVNPDYLCAVAPSVRGLQPARIPPQLWWNIEMLSVE